MQTWLWYFFAYAFLGWCTEVAFAALSKGRFVNRGFLNGPVCPIYGFGIVLVLWVLGPLTQNLLWLYLGSVVLTTALELATGFLMEKLFHQRWWDYSKMPLNVGGYICPLFSFLWGIACVLIVDVLHPRIARLIAFIPEPWSTAALALMLVALLTDVVVTAATVAHLNRRLRQVDEAAAAIRGISDSLGMAVADGALAVRAIDERAVNDLQAANERNLAEVKARYAQLLERRSAGQRRLLRAFPQLRSLRYPAALDTLKQRLEQLSQKHPH